MLVFRLSFLPKPDSLFFFFFATPARKCNVGKAGAIVKLLINIAAIILAIMHVLCTAGKAGGRSISQGIDKYFACKGRMLNGWWQVKTNKHNVNDSRCAFQPSAYSNALNLKVLLSLWLNFENTSHNVVLHACRAPAGIYFHLYNIMPWSVSPLVCSTVYHHTQLRQRFHDNASSSSSSVLSTSYFFFAVL